MLALTRTSLVLALLSLPACEPAESIVDTGGLDSGRDAPGLDGPGTDAPAADVPGTDAPEGAPDVPDGVDGGIDLDAPAVDGGAPMAEGCITSVAAGHHLFPCDGIDYDVEISGPCASGGCGLIFDVHGATMSAAIQDANTNLRALGAAAGYVVVQPTAPVGASGLLRGPMWDPVRDDPKVFAFLELTMRALRIDVDRVHFTGFSQGGFMTWRMLCDHADVFASVAPAAACGGLFRGCSFGPSDRPAREVPVLYIHGSGDLIVSGCSTTQRDQVVAGWSMTMDSVLSTDGSHTWTRYLSGAGTPFEFIGHSYSAYSYILAGHCMPGSTDIGTDRFGTNGYGCTGSSPVNWGQAALAFFVAHPRG